MAQPLQRHQQEGVMRLTSLSVLATTLCSSAAHAGPQVVISGQSGGTAQIVVNNGYLSVPPYSRPDVVPKPRNVTLTVPGAVAHRFAVAAEKGGVRVSSVSSVSGPQLRLIAGRGRSAVVIERISFGDESTGQGSSGDVKVQFGFGSQARAFFVGRLKPRMAVDHGLVTGGSWGITRFGILASIDPATLLPASQQSGGSWWLKPTSRRTPANPGEIHARNGYDVSDDISAPVVNAAAQLSVQGLRSASDTAINTTLALIDGALRKASPRPEGKRNGPPAGSSRR